MRTVQSRVPEPREMEKALVRVSLEHVSLMCESPTLYGVTVKLPDLRVTPAPGGILVTGPTLTDGYSLQAC